MDHVFEPELSATVSGDCRTMTIEIADDGYTSLQFAVWSDENGQDDLTWYQAAMESGVWTAEADLTAHHSAGNYNIHAYAIKNNEQICAGTTTASTYIDSGTWGNLKWTLSRSGLLSIYGTGGDMDAFTEGSTEEWLAYKSKIITLEAYNITSVGSYAFDGCTYLTSAKLPTQVTVIGTAAFRNCSALSSMTETT